MIVGWNWRKHWECKLMLKCQHQCHCTCSSEIGTCIINDAGIQAAHKPPPTICIDVFYCPPLLASENITHPWNSRCIGKILLYIDHHHMECLNNIAQHSGIVSLYFNIWQNIMTYFYSHLYNVWSIFDFIHMWRIRKKFFLSLLGPWCEVNVAKLLCLDDQQTVFNYKMAYIYIRQTDQLIRYGVTMTHRC